MSSIFYEFLPPCLPGLTAGKNTFLLDKSDMSVLAKKNNVRIGDIHLKWQDPPQLKIIDARFFTSPLKNLSQEDLLNLSGLHPEDADVAIDYLSSLRDEFVRTINRIVSDYPEEWQGRLPSSFEEREIYDSVIGVMEDDELDDLNVALGGSPVLMTEALKTSLNLFDKFEDMVIGTGMWGKKETLLSFKKNPDKNLRILPGITGPSSVLIINKAVKGYPKDELKDEFWVWYKNYSQVNRIAGKYLEE